MGTARPDMAGDPRVRVMTVAQVREAGGAGRDTEVMFNESARFYSLRRNLAGYGAFVRLLREAHATGRAVVVRLTLPHGDVIESVEIA